MEPLDPADWRAREAVHAARIDARLTPHLERRQTHTPHPVEDFLYTYYSVRPHLIRRWHPGYGVALAEAPERAGWKGYEVTADSSARVSDAHLAGEMGLIDYLCDLLTATAARVGSFGCFGMHEWAMVYKQPDDQVRHAAVPLRLGSAGTDQVIEANRVQCSHFDAFRFFTPDAEPLNLLQPGPRDRPAFEQPACLHANMDLYKHAMRLSPLIPSELVADCFELAHDIRVMDMRASPYDLTALGYSAIEVETPAGKAEYVEGQRHFAERSAPLRARLIAECGRLRIHALGELI